MMTRSTFVLAALVITGCAASPLSPTPTQTPSPTVTAPTTPQPVAAPAPAPAPTTPAPSTPAPAPTMIVYDATTTAVHWYGAALFGETFTVTRTADQITIGDLTLPILSQPGPLAGDLTAGDWRGVGTFSIEGGQWTFSGTAGLGSGSIARR